MTIEEKYEELKKLFAKDNVTVSKEEGYVYLKKQWGGKTKAAFFNYELEYINYILDNKDKIKF